MILNPECYFGDHTWRGGSQCSCGARLRCVCGRFVREDSFDAHYPTCPIISKLDEQRITPLLATYWAAGAFSNGEPHAER